MLKDIKDELVFLEFWMTLKGYIIAKQEVEILLGIFNG